MKQGSTALRVSDVNEDDILAAIAPYLPCSRHIRVPSGDDCAVLSVPSGQVAISTDMLVEGRHFRRDWSTGFDVGLRCVAQNVADSVAMGAQPLSLVVAIQIPSDTPLSWVTDCARGLGEAARCYGVGIDGGDIVAGDSVTVSATIVGDMCGREPIVRSGARSGDIVIHSGELGYSAAGLELLKRGYRRDNAPVDSAISIFIDRFCAPQPPVHRALEAVDTGKINAMMDVSDGLMRDASRIAKASKVCLDIDSSALQRDIDALMVVAKHIGVSDPWQWALERVLTGGEDHGFLATMPSHGHIPVGFRAIGRVRENRGEGRIMLDGREYRDAGGFDHFAPTRP